MSLTDFPSVVIAGNRLDCVQGHQVAVNGGQYEQLGLGRGVPPAAIGNSAEFYNGYARVASPAWRDDDKDGHYMFELGENITPRCNHTFNPGRSVRSHGLAFVTLRLLLPYVAIGGADS